MTTREEHMRPFTDILGELSAGETLKILTEDLAQVVSAVKETGNQGELTLKLTVKPNGENRVVIADKITGKIPKADRGDSLFYADDGGALHRNDPKQAELPLRVVPGTTHDPETGEVH